MERETMANNATARKASTKTNPKKSSKQLVSFKWESLQYTLDLQRNRVYQNWMAVESNKACTILGAYRSDATA
jgi:hypothetical protein